MPSGVSARRSRLRCSQPVGVAVQRTSAAATRFFATAAWLDSLTSFYVLYFLTALGSGANEPTSSPLGPVWRQ